jgi:viroplasmin and RNaseH domain-containing protein
MNTVELKEGQTYVCVKSDKPWWTTGKEYMVISNSYGELCLVDNDNDKWVINYLNNRKDCQFKLKEIPSKAETEKRTYTLFEVNKVILRAYNMYDTDAQRLAFIKGYFAK